MKPQEETSPTSEVIFEHNIFTAKNTRQKVLLVGALLFCGDSSRDYRSLGIAACEDVCPEPSGGTSASTANEYCQSGYGVLYRRYPR